MCNLGYCKNFLRKHMEAHGFFLSCSKLGQILPAPHIDLQPGDSQALSCGWTWKLVADWVRRCDVSTDADRARRLRVLVCGSCFSTPLGFPCRGTFHKHKVSPPSTSPYPNFIAAAVLGCIASRAQ